MTEPAAVPQKSTTRIPSGVPGFDALVQGGFPAGASIVVQGPAGVEKDGFLAQFVADALRNNGAALVVLTSLPRARFQETLRSAGVDVDRAVEEQRLRFVEWLVRSEQAGPQVEVDGPTFRSSGGLPNAAVAISRAIDALPRDGEKRAALDILSPALLVADPSTVVGFARAMRTILERFGFTSLFALEKTHDASIVTSLHRAFDGVVDIERVREGDELVRKLAVLSLKGTALEAESVRIAMRPDGLILQVGRDAINGGPPPSRPSPVPGRDAESLRPPSNGDKQSPAQQPSDRQQADDAVARHLAMATEQLRKDPENADALFVKAASFARRGRRQDLVSAIETLETLAKIDEMYPGLWRLKAKIHGGLGEREKAEECHFRAVEVEQFRELAAKSLARPTAGRETPISGKPKVSPDATRLGRTNGLARPPARGPGRTNGLVNGLERLRAGVTNGLAISGKGRINGMTNGVKGRINGLTNGVAYGPPGRTNGVASTLRSRTDGLTNGDRGRTSDIGWTNGLTNGNGFTNGLGAGRLRREAAATKWKLYVIPLLSIALLLLPLLSASPTTGRSPLRIDGDAGDWNPAAIAAQARSVGPNPDVDIVRFGIADNVDALAFFIEVDGVALRGGDAPPTLDVFRVFLDTDRSPTTGYRVDGLGADRMLVVSGWHGAVNTSVLFEWDTNREAFDWRGWTKGTPAMAAVSGPRLEAQVDWLAILPTKAPVYATAHARSYDGTDDVADYVLSSDGPSVVVVQDAVVSDVVSGTSQLLRLDMSASGLDATITGITVTLTGSSPYTAVPRLRLIDAVGAVVDERVPLDRRVPFAFPARTLRVGTVERWYVIAESPPGTGETLGAFVAAPADVIAASGPVTLRTSASPRDVGYLGSVPAGPRIDGGFAEWMTPLTDTANDVAGVPRTNLDLDAFDSRSSGGRSFFFAQVTGSMMAGTWVPVRNEPTPRFGAAPADQDRDGVPDSVDPLPFDFNNNGVPDSQSGGDYDGDGVIDYGQVGGTDEVLNTTIPSTFPAPYAGRTVQIYIGPVTEPYRSPDDMLRVFVDLDNDTMSGYSIGGLGADRMVEVAGTAGRVQSAGLYAFAGNYPGEWNWIPFGNVSFALGSRRIEVSTPVNVSSPGSRFYVEIGNALGSSDTSTPGGVATRGTSGVSATSFAVASLPVPMTPPRPSTSGATRGNTLIDAYSNKVSTLYNHQRKVVRAGDVAGDTACDATNSDGCWYSVFSDQSGPEDAATTTAGTETVTRGSKVSGTFPADIAGADGAYVNYRELKYQIGAIGYKSSTGNGVNFPKQLDWTTSAWGTPETELDSAGAAVENVRVVWDTSGDSTLFWIVLNTGVNIHAYECTNADSCTKEDVDPSSGNDYAVTQAVGTAPERHWDVSIEATSGKLLLVYDNPAAVANDFCYRTRTAGGSGTWSSETCFNHSSVASTNPSFSYVVLANNPGSNRIGFGAFDTTNDDFVVAVWDGSAWVNANKAVSTGVTLTGGWGGTVVAEDTADEFVAYAGNGADSMAECEWTSSGGWEATCATFDPNTVAGNDLRIMFAAPLAGTNKAMVCQGDDLADNTCWRWSGVTGTGGTRGTIKVQTTGDGSAGTIDMRTGYAWNPDQSGTSDGLVVYYDGTSGSLSYNTYNDATDGWGTASTFTSAGSHKWIQLVAPSDSGSADKVHVVVSNSNSDILAYRWSGTGAPGTEQSITADTANENYPYWDLEFQGEANYHLEVRHDWTGIPAGDAYTLKVKGYRGDENINVQVLTPPSTWTTRLTVTATTNTLITYVLTNAEYNGGTPAIRLVDPAAVDTTQSDVFIDLSVVVTEGHSDRVFIMRSLDTSGSTWGSQVLLASGNTAPFSTATGSFNIGTGAVGTTVTVTTGFQPKVYFLWESGAIETTDTATGSNMKRGFGVGISTTDRRAVCSFSNNANGGADTSSGHRADAVLCSLTSAQALDALVDHDAMLSNGFRVIIDDTSSKDLRVHYLAIGGTDLTNVVSGMFTEPGATGNQDITDVGFQPDAVVLFSADIASDPPGIQADSSLMIGVAAGAGNPNDVVWAGGSNNGANPTQTVAYSRAGESIALLNAGVTATDGRAEVDAWLSNGFSLNWNERAASRRIFYVALKGGQHAVGDLLTRTDTTQFSETGLPFTPKAGLFLSHTHAQSTADTVQDYDEWSVGSVTNATTRRAMCANDEDNVATTVVRYGVHHNELYCNLATSAAFEGLMDVVSVNSDGWTFVMDDADPTAAFVGYWAIGASTPTPFYGYDSAEPSIAMDSSGYLHVAWVSASATGDQSTLNRVRYTKTTVTYPTQAELASSANWAAVTAVDDTYPGYMPTISTDSSGNPHIAWSQSKSAEFEASAEYRSNTGTNTVSSPKTRDWDGASWTSEAEQSTAGSPIRGVRMAWSPTNLRERIVVTQSDDGYLDAYVCTPTCTVTNNIGQVWSSAPSQPQKRFDIAYEGLSGDALLVYGVLSTDTTRDIAYRTYVGGSWSAEQYLDDTGHSTDVQYATINLASKKGSDQIGMIGGDITNNDANAWIWDGSSWGSNTEITGSAESPDQEEIAMAWESSSGDLLAVSAQSGSTSIISKTFTTSWSSSSTVGCIDRDPAHWLSLKANPLSTADDMVLITGDDNPQMSSCYWTGSAWANAHLQIGGSSTSTRTFDFAWEDTGSKGLLVYGASSGQITRKTFTAPDTWGSATNTAMGSNGHPWVTLRTNPAPLSGDTKILGAVMEATALDLGAIKWDGTTFTVIGASTLTADTGVTTYDSYDLEYHQASGGNVFYKNKAAGTWRATVLYGRLYTGISVDVSPQNNYVSLVRYMEGSTNEVQYAVCKDLSTSNCDATTEFTKAGGSAGVDTVATGVETSTYPSLATTYEANGDLWVAYPKDVDGTTRAIYARFLDYPGATWATAETVDSLSGTIFTKPSIGVDKDNNLYALYVGASGPQVYYSKRTGVTWSARLAIDISSDNPTIMVRSPNDATYGTTTAGLYWKTTTSETYFHIPEFETVAVPIAVCFLVLWGWRRESRRTRRSRGTTRDGEIPIGLSLVDGADVRSASVGPEEVRDSSAA